MLQFVIDMFRSRAKAFIGPFVGGVLAALFSGMEAAGFPLSEAAQASLSMVVMGWFISNTANAKPMALMGDSSGWGSNFKEFFLQILMAILAFLGIGQIGG